MTRPDVARAQLRHSTVAHPSWRTALAPGARFIAPLVELWAFREVLEELVKRDLKVRYKRSALGILWTMLNPLLMMAAGAVIYAGPSFL